MFNLNYSQPLTKPLTFIISISLVGCGAIPLGSTRNEQLTNYPECKEKIENLDDLSKLLVNKNVYAKSCISKVKNDRHQEKLQEMQAINKKFKECSMQGYGYNYASMKECEQSMQALADHKNKRKAYLASPKGIAETQRKQEQKKLETEACHAAGRDIEKKYNFGQYQGTIATQRISDEMIMCIASFSRESIYGYAGPIHLAITYNKRNGQYKFSKT